MPNNLYDVHEALHDLYHDVRGEMPIHTVVWYDNGVLRTRRAK